MGLAEVVQRAAKSAFVAIGNIPRTCTYTSVSTPVYNPATGTYSGGPTAYIGLTILFEDYSAREIQESAGTIISTDQKASIPNLSLTPVPKVSDTITDPDSVVWRIEDKKLDAARALWVFQVRTS